jgi:hypothetical protein
MFSQVRTAEHLQVLFNYMRCMHRQECWTPTFQGSALRSARNRSKTRVQNGCARPFDSALPWTAGSRQQVSAMGWISPGHDHS